MARPVRLEWVPETDHVTVVVDIELSLWDRLRALWHGKIKVNVLVYAERNPGKTRAESTVWVPQLRPMKPEMLVAGFGPEGQDES